MVVRGETIKTPGEMGAWSPEGLKRTLCSTLRSRGASPLIGIGEVRCQLSSPAYRRLQ